MASKSPALFICNDHTARSRMAAAFTRSLSGGHVDAISAGFESNAADALAVDAMSEVGISLQADPAPHVFERYLEGIHPLRVVRIADRTAGERCPIYPGVATSLEWDLPDPTKFYGTPEERRRRFVDLRERIHVLVRSWLDSLEIAQAAA